MLAIQKEGVYVMLVVLNYCKDWRDSIFSFIYEGCFN